MISRITEGTGQYLYGFKFFFVPTISIILLFYFEGLFAQPYLLNSGQDVDGYVMHPDGSHITYVINQKFKTEPIIGGDVVSISPDIDSGLRIFDFSYTQDGSHIVFQTIASEPQNAINSLNIESGVITTLYESNYLMEWSISADGQFVLYRTKTHPKVFVSSIDGASQTQINLPDQYISDRPTFSPDSGYVLFYVSSGDRDLYSYNLNSGVRAKLNSAGPVVTVIVTPDSKHVVYRSSSEKVEGTFTHGVVDLYKVPIEGGQSTNLVQFSKGSGISGSFGLSNEFDLSPDGKYIIYRADQDVDGVFELYLISINGGATRKLNGPLVAGGDVIDMTFSPNSRYVVYRARQDNRSVMELYSTSVHTGDVVKLNGNEIDTETNIGLSSEAILIKPYSVSPDSKHVVYALDREVPGFTHTKNVYMVSISGGKKTRVNRVLTDTEVAYGGLFTPGGARLVYGIFDTLARESVLLGTLVSTCPITTVEGDVLCRANTLGVVNFSAVGEGNKIEQTVTFESDLGTVEDLFLDLNGIRETFMGNVTVTLSAPDGTSAVVWLKNDNRVVNFAGLYRFIDSGNDLATTISGLTPSQTLPSGDYAASSGGAAVSFADTFLGVKAQGDWTLKVEGDFGGGAGVLSNWKLSLLTKSSSFFLPITALNGRVFTIEL